MAAPESVPDPKIRSTGIFWLILAISIPMSLLCIHLCNSYPVPQPPLIAALMSLCSLGFIGVLGSLGVLIIRLGLRIKYGSRWPDQIRQELIAQALESQKSTS